MDKNIMDNQENLLECGVCHTMLPVDTKVCPKCGNVFKKIENASKIYKPCPKCGKNVHIKLGYCQNCGFIQTKIFIITGIIGFALLIGVILWGYRGYRLICTGPLTLFALWLTINSLKDIVKRIPKKKKTISEDSQSSYRSDHQSDHDF